MPTSIKPVDKPAPAAVANPKLRFALLVTGPCYGTQAASDAYRFAKAVIEQGHTLSQVFFYQEGVHNANRLLVPANDETNLHQAWVELALELALRLDVCVAAALRRGVSDELSAQQAGLAQWNLSEPFYLSGLGQQAEAALTADRIVQF